MNKRQQFIVIVVVLFVAVVMVYFSFAAINNDTKNGTDEIAETEEGLPVHEILYGPPVTDVTGPFTIEYIQTKDRVDYIKVVDSSPQGRMNAMHWLRERGIDPTDLDIQFDDFANPLKSEGN